MADSETTNYQLILPEVGASKSTWGQKLNSNFTIIDELLKLRMPVKANGRIDNSAAIEGVFPTLSLVESDQPANARRWDIEGRDGDITLSLRTDAGALTASIFRFDRDGGVGSDMSILRRAAADSRYLRPNGNGSLLTNLNASNLASGTLPDARLTGAYSMTSLTLSDAPTAVGHATRKDYVDTQVGGRLTQTQADERYVNTGSNALLTSLVLDFLRANNAVRLGPNDAFGSVYLSGEGNLGLQGVSGGFLFYGNGGPSDPPVASTILSRTMGDRRYLLRDGSTAGTGALTTYREGYGTTGLNTFGYGVRIGYGEGSEHTTNLTSLLRGYQKTLSQPPSSAVVVIDVRTNGNIVNLNNSYGAISDPSLKHSIVDASDQLADLMQMRVVNFVLNDDPDGVKQIGFLSSEIKAIKPGWVDADENGVESVKYSLLPLSLLKGVQQLVRRVEALEAATGV